MARSLKGCLFGGFILYTWKKNIGIIHNCWLARSRGAFWEVSYFIPGKKILVWLMARLLKGCHLGGFKLYTWLIKHEGLILYTWKKNWNHGRTGWKRVLTLGSKLYIELSLPWVKIMVAKCDRSTVFMIKNLEVFP